MIAADEYRMIAAALDTDDHGLPLRSARVAQASHSAEERWSASAAVRLFRVVHEANVAVRASDYASHLHLTDYASHSRLC